MEKLYKKIGWKNKPNLATPLGATNLNKMDEAIDGLDNRIIELDNKDAEQGRHIEGLYAETRKNAQAIEEVRESTQYIDSFKIITNKSGSPAYIDDASNMNIENIVFYGESKQNGTPTPTSPIPIESKIVNRIVVSGKNFFGFGESAIDKTTELRPLADQRLTFTKINDNTIKCNYTGGTYGTGFVEIGGIDGTKDYAISFVNKENALGYTPRIEKYASHCTENKLVLSIYSGCGNNEISSDNYFILSNIQVELGTTATPFEQFKGIQTVNLSAPIELNGIEDVKDYIDTERGVFVQKFVVGVFNGSESWSSSSVVGGRYILILNDIKKGSKALCTQAENGDNNSKKVNEFYVSGTSAEIVINTSFATINEWKAHLQSNPMTVVYELAEPIETELPIADQTAIKNLHTYKPNTVVMNDADAEMDVHYVADAKTYIDKKFEALASAIVNQ